MSKAMANQPGGVPAKIRCAIYCRKSSEEGLELAFNSLHAQRESGEAFIASQRNEGWVCLPDEYNDGGYSGGNIERPALRRLLADINANKIDCVVVYKVDRLSRSLMDFARIMEVFEKHKVVFSAVTQAFSTANSMGRLTLNVLLSFAQFERELVSERTRDKIAAARKKGKWAGGKPVLGYDMEQGTHRLVVNADEAQRVRIAFATYLRTGSLIETVRELNETGCTTKRAVTLSGRVWGGRPWTKESLHRTLHNVLYRGQVRHFKDVYPGEHPPIIDEATWEAVQARLKAHGRSGGMHARNAHGALLKGLLHCKPCGRAMGHSFTVKRPSGGVRAVGSGERGVAGGEASSRSVGPARAAKRNAGGTRVCYRYYVCHKAQSEGYDACPCKSVPAEQIEQLVVGQIRKIASDPSMRAMVYESASAQARPDGLEAELAIVERQIRTLHSQVAAAVRGQPAGASDAAAMGRAYEEIAAREQDAQALQARIDAAHGSVITKAQVDAGLAEFERVWAALRPKEQCEILGLLVERVDLDASKGTVAIKFHATGLRSLAGAGRLAEEAA